jgi:hypothetical protein
LAIVGFKNYRSAMKRFLFCAAAFVLLGVMPQGAEAQINRKNIKKNNKRIATYRGRKTHFGKDKVYNMVGISLNSLHYFGDLSPTPKRISTDLSLTRPAIGFSFTHRFGPRYQLQTAFTYGGIRGSDTESADQSDTENGIFRYNRNLSFRNRIKELSVIAQIDLWENQSTYISRVQWTPYLYAGIAIFHHNPQARAPETDAAGNPTGRGGQWVNLQPLGTEGQYATLQPGDANFGIKPYKRIQPSIPFGIGARFRLNEVMDIAAEWGFRYTFTDYLDDVSRNYVDLGVFGDNHLARAMSYRSNEVATPNHTYVGRDGATYNVLLGYGSENPENMRGNKSNRDILMITTVRLTYIIGKTFHRAKFR